MVLNGALKHASPSILVVKFLHWLTVQQKEWFAYHETLLLHANDHSQEKTTIVLLLFIHQYNAYKVLRDPQFKLKRTPGLESIGLEE